VAEIDRALVAESARWGDAQVNHTRPGQPYTRENSWLPHLDWMAANYWSRQPATALTRLKAAGLFPAVSAPRFSPDGGTTLSNPNPAAGTLFYTTSGEDPRQWGGTINPAARSATADVTLAVPGRTLVRARVRQGTVWSALAEKWFPPGPDLDEDGIDDTWETIHGFSNSDPSDATLDSDGDGQNTLEEFLANTDPRRASSRVHLRASTPSPGDGSIMLHFELPAGRRAVHPCLLWATTGNHRHQPSHPHRFSTGILPVTNQPSTIKKSSPDSPDSTRFNPDRRRPTRRRGIDERNAAGSRPGCAG
jgi:hypothetical protein